MERKILLCLVLSTLFQLDNADYTRDKSRALMNTMLRDYYKGIPPKEDKPVVVKIGMYVKSIEFPSISSGEKEMRLHMYMRQSWKDPRLQFNPDDNNGQSKILASEYMLDDLWKPDLFFRNAKDVKFYHAPSSQKMARISSDGSVWYVTTLSAALTCPMKLQKYPFDTQHCPIMFESYAHTMDTMYFEWLDSPVDLDPAINLPAYTLKDKILYDCSQNYTMSSGAFPCLEVRFVIRRDVGSNMKQYFLPSILIVILSWIGFWIRIEETSARVIPGILLILMLMVMSYLARVPLVSYITAMDVWMGVCVLMVFLSLVEFGVVLFLQRRNGDGDSAKGSERQGSTVPDKIDFFSRIIFPCVFLLFNIIYWCIYRV